MRLRKTKTPAGSVHIQLVSGKGLPARDSNGLSDPYVKFQMGKQKHRSQVCFKTLNPVWKEEFVLILTGQDSFNKDTGIIDITVWDKDTYRKDDFIGSPVKDIHDILVFTVMDEDRDGESDFLGKVTLPLLRAVNGIEKTYALKDKKLLFRAKGSITVQVQLIYNKARAAIRTFNPREENYSAAEPKFKLQLLKRNFSRLWSCIQSILAVGEFINSCFTWQNPTRSAIAFLVYILFVWNVELYMIPILLLLLLARNYYHIVHKKNMVDRYGCEQNEKFQDDDDEYEDNEESNSKVSLLQRLKSIEEILLKVQNVLDWLSSLLERIHNTFMWSVPFLSALAVIVLYVVTIILYFVSLRTIALLWGLNKFTKRLRKPNYIPNNELLDFLSRIPSDVELDELQELQVNNVSPRSSKKKR